MKKILKSICDFLVFLPLLGGYALLRILPLGAVRALGRTAGRALRLLPGMYRTAMANLAIAFPEKSEVERRRIALASFCNIAMDLAEFIWYSGVPHRIERCCTVDPESLQELRTLEKQKVRILYVTPHLGSWEASGQMAPYFAHTPLAAIAKPQGNRFINDFFNHRNRERSAGVRIILSRGAMKATVKALREGWSIGLLIDQNTKAREGGIFVDFFGLPVSSSKSPATLMHFCRTNQIPAVIRVAVTVRQPDGRLKNRTMPLPRPFEEYPDDRAVIQELLQMTETFIRQYPEQYLWFYHRFNYIPMDADEALKKRYPFYAVQTDETFYDTAARLRRKREAAKAHTRR